MAPRAVSFGSSYEAMSEKEDIDERVDDSITSFMAGGDKVFEDEVVDEEGKTRKDVISGVRDNILRRLGEENQKSVTSAERQRGLHDKYSTDLIAEFARLGRTEREIEATDDAYIGLVDKENRDDQSGANSFIRFFKFRKSRMNSNRRKRDALNTRLLNESREIRQKAARWSVLRSDYKRDTVNNHYKTYDKLAKSWYEFTHEKAVSALPETATEEEKRAAMAERSIPDEYSKRIVEYTGIYDMNALDELLNSFIADPDTAVSVGSFAKIPYKTKGNTSANEEDINNLTKTHKMIVMLTEADSGTGIRSRFKFDPSFLGARAKRQFTAADTEETALTGEAPGERIHAERAGLESDRRDINGNFLFSETNAEVLHARLKRNGQTVHGFYSNGEFLTDDEEGEETEDGGRRVSGKKDMKFFGRRNWDKQEQADKLRIAIRTSPFFQHVNSRTIQYYAGYDAGSDYGEAIEEAMDKRWERAEEEGFNVSRDGAYRYLADDPQKLEGVPEAIRGPFLAEYIREAVKGDEFPFDDPGADPVLTLVFSSYRKALPLTCLLLLANEEDPRLWDLARSIIVKNPNIVKARTLQKMKYLPEKGTMMRMGLLDELYKYGGNEDIGDEEEEDEEADILEKLQIPGKQVLEEELNNKRGAWNWIKRNLLNGKIIKHALGAANAGMKAADQISDIKKISEESGMEEKSAEEEEEREEAEEKEKESREEREFWFSYGETMAESNNVLAILSGAGVLATNIKFGGEVAGRARDIGFQAFDVIDIVNSVIDVAKGVKKYWKKLFSEKTDEEKEKEKRALKDLDSGEARSFLAFLNKTLGLVNSARDLASYHVASEETWGAVVNETWGELLAFRGPLDYALTTAQNIIDIISDGIEIAADTKRIGRLMSADEDIETAINRYNSPRDNLPGVVDPEEERQRKLGQAASENSQAQYFMSLAKAQSRKQRSAAGWDIASKTLSIGKDTFASFVDPSGSIVGKAIKAGLSIAPKLVDFVGWTIGKLKYDRGNFNDNIASMLGDKSYAKTPYFDKVLKRETGIVSSAYLLDTAKIFMSIDTHSLINKENPSDGEKALSKSVVGTLYGNVTDENMTDITLSDMLKYSGLSSESDWRSLLRNAIKA